MGEMSQMTTLLSLDFPLEKSYFEIQFLKDILLRRRYDV